MSYSHAADGKLAPALQSALHQFAKPWYRMRAMRVFRDKTSLAMTPELWPSIQAALSQSEYFLLLASPQAAQSPWVEKEVEWWLQQRTAQTLFIVLTEGEAIWDSTSGDFNWAKTNALPEILQGKFKNEPLYVDLRWAKTVENLSLRHSQFRPAILDISSPLLGKPKDELDGEDVQQHRRFRAITRLVVVTLTLLTLLLAAGIIGVVLQTRELGHQASLVSATAAQTASDRSYLDRALRFAVLANTNTWLSPKSIEAEPQLVRAAHASTMQVSFPHSGTVGSATFSPDGTKVITASLDNTARAWDFVTGKELARFAHEGSLWSATFSPGGTKIVTASFDHTAQVWDVATGKELARLVHEDSVHSATFSPDGTKIITASEDKTARLWDIHWLTQYHGQELIERVCHKKLVGARHITKRDIEISPILSGREGEDVCDPPSWFSRLAKNLGFGSKQTGNSN